MTCARPCCCCNGYDGWGDGPVPPAGIQFVQESDQVAFYDAPAASISFAAPLLAAATVFVSLSMWDGRFVLSLTVGGVPAVRDVATPTGAAVVTELWRAHGPFASADVDLVLSDPGYGAMVATEFSGVAAAPPLSTDAQEGDECSYPDPGTSALVMTIARDMSFAGPGHWQAPLDYALSLDFADWLAASSGASAWRVLPAASPGVVAWSVDDPGSLAVGCAVYEPAA